jgi:hypothetical protein
MVKFLEDLLNPLTLLTSMDQAKNFVAQHDVRFNFFLSSEHC